jgi:PAS domain S-box-containing protein
MQAKGLRFMVSWSPNPKTKTVKSTLRILNLEDDPKDSELNEAMLSARWPQCELMRVDTRRDFIAALEQEDLDLIISDYTMPNFNGLEALAIARERRPEVPFLFVSGTIGEDTAIEALKHGATDYVLKHRLMRLIPAVDRTLRETEANSERERAEECMRQSEYKYRTLFEALGDGAFLIDQETGKVIDVNDTATSMIGSDRAKILGRNQFDFLALTEANADDRRVMECAMLCTDGNKVPVEVHNTWLALYGRPLVLRLCHQKRGKNKAAAGEQLMASQHC